MRRGFAFVEYRAGEAASVAAAGAIAQLNGAQLNGGTLQVVGSQWAQLTDTCR